MNSAGGKRLLVIWFGREDGGLRQDGGLGFGVEDGGLGKDRGLVKRMGGLKSWISEFFGGWADGGLR